MTARHTRIRSHTHTLHTSFFSLLAHTHPLLLTDTSPEERTQLFIRKIEQCCYIFDFADPMTDLRAKEIKRAALNEVLDYMSSYKGVLSEPVYPEVVRMVI